MRNETSLLGLSAAVSYILGGPDDRVYTETVLRYHVAFYLPPKTEKMVVAKVLDFPGGVSQGFDLADARSMICGALEDLAQSWVELGKPLPQPDPDASDPEADLVEVVPLSITVGVET